MKKEDEKNDFCLDNPDGKIQNLFESRNDFSNDKKNFVQENNVADVKEQEYVEERFVSKPQKRQTTTTNLKAVSGLLATTAVAVASTVVIVVSVIAASVLGVQLFATTSDSLTFYFQEYLSSVEHSYYARLFNEDKQVEQMLIEGAFVEFYGLMPNSTYTLKVVDVESEEVMFEQEYTTAPENYEAVSFESKIEDGSLIILTYNSQNSSVFENVSSYTISVFDEQGTNIYEKTVGTLEQEYVVPLPSDSEQSSENSGADPQQSSNVNSTEEIYYAGVVYQKDGNKIGRIQQTLKSKS